MSFISYIGSIAASVINKNKQNLSKKTLNIKNSKDKITKEQYLKLIENGKCGICGEKEGEYKGICDYCRFS